MVNKAERAPAILVAAWFFLWAAPPLKSFIISNYLALTVVWVRPSFYPAGRMVSQPDKT
jgi:hypothetical protein